MLTRPTPRIAHRMPIIHAEPRASSRPARMELSGRSGALIARQRRCASGECSTQPLAVVLEVDQTPLRRCP